METFGLTEAEADSLEVVTMLRENGVSEPVSARGMFIYFEFAAKPNEPALNRRILKLMTGEYKGMLRKNKLHWIEAPIRPSSLRGLAEQLESKAINGRKLNELLATEFEKFLEERSTPSNPKT
jgi:Asp-tRNA(Asn)/Glu-tRNA(Gln) amidotransferase B subunit